MDISRNIQKLKKFIILWFGQSVSGLGSSMTSFAITIWLYERTGSALMLSISGISIMLPKMAGGILAGPFVDRLNKKKVMLCADFGAGLCSLALFFLLWTNKLETWHIYSLNLIISFLGSFQTPACDVTISLIVPKDYYVKTSGMQSFSTGLIQVLSPVIAAFMLSITGITGVIIFDFITLLFACFTLIFFVKMPLEEKSDKLKLNLKSYIMELANGFNAIKSKRLLVILLIFFSFINFVAGMTYFNLLSPMILARSNDSSQALGFVNGAIGLGGIIGGVLITFIPTAKNKIKAMFLCTGLSFIFGDTLLALGNSVLVWAVAGFLSSVFLPVINANESYFWRTLIPIESQGRVFSFKYALQSGMIPVGLLVGGLLADYIFEPFMINGHNIFTNILGSGKGSGMALMFLSTGILGFGISVLGYINRSMQKIEGEVK